MVGDAPVSGQAAEYRRRRIRTGRPRRVDQPSRWRARALILVLLVVIGTLAWRTLTETARVRSEVHRQLCQLAERTYSPPASTADGRRRQAANRQFAKDVLGCNVR